MHFNGQFIFYQGSCAIKKEKKAWLFAALFNCFMLFLVEEKRRV
jgi:hypothetical protein